MLGFLTKTKQKSKAPEEKNRPLATQDPLQKDVLKDALSPGVQQQGQDKKVEDKESQSQQEKPEEKEKEKAKEASGPGFLDKLFRTKKFRQDAEHRAEKLPFAEIMSKHWELAYSFAKTEFSAENFDCWKALESSASNSLVYETWIDEKSATYLNIPGQLRNVYKGQATKGEFGQMDMAPLKREVVANIADTLSRFRFTKPFIHANEAKW